MLKRIYKLFKQSPDTSRRIHAAFDEGSCMCESCGAATPLASLTPLTIFTCPSCGFKGLVPYILGEYILMLPLGAGGVASVYQAFHRSHPKNAYAVKLLRTDKAIDEKILSEFLFEAEVHHQVSPHPSIVQFIEQGESNGEYFHVMEFVPGDSIKRRVESAGRIPHQQALSWLKELVGALKHILVKGYLYRDISPGNLLVRENLSLCLIDFGLALPVADADAESRTQELLGTPEYMPPERIQHLGEDERSSIYSLGMLLIYMIKGEALIKAESHERAALQHISAVRVAFSARMLPADCPEPVFQLISRMIKYDPVDRHQSFDELEGAIQGILGA
ncbi:MAG TPA: serine/threonine-protein kinase [Kiritimatiellia bacterium]|nr:serine/threonine-protein kinase [Kiritimatiellia bacterium]